MKIILEAFLETTKWLIDLLALQGPKRPFCESYICTLNIGSTLVFSPKNNNDEKYFQFNFIWYFLKLWKFGKFKRKFVLIFQNVSTFPHYSLKIFWPKSVNAIKTIFSHSVSLKIYFSKSFIFYSILSLNRQFWIASPCYSIFNDVKI